MADGSYDFAILGSTPLAALVAGLLAASHGKRVCLVGEPFSPFRLQRGIDLSIAPVTRPETLVLTKRVAAETGKLIGGWGKGLIGRVDPIFVAETPDTIAALGHFRHLAAALGYAVEPLADRSVAAGLMLRVRDAQLLGHSRFEPALEDWLNRHEVRHLDPAETAISVRKDGVVRITYADRTVEADHAVFGSDAAILQYLPEEARDRSLVVLPGSAFLLEGGKPLSAPYLSFLDRGVTLAQDGKVSITALATGSTETARARLGSSTAKAGPLRIAGEVAATSIGTTDGAPYVGVARGIRATILAGLGPTGAWLAPAIARHLAGVATADEAQWFAARGPTRGNLRQLVADYHPVPA